MTWASSASTSAASRPEDCARAPRSKRRIGPRSSRPGRRAAASVQEQDKNHFLIWDPAPGGDGSGTRSPRVQSARRKSSALHHAV